MLDNISDKWFLVIGIAIIIFLIYNIVRTEQIWSHLKYEKQMKDIQNQQILGKSRIKEG